MKNKLVKKTDTLLTIVPAGAEMDAAARINHFHRLSIQAGEVAVKAALEVGMALFQEKILRGGTFQAWVEQNCEFSRATAYRYLELLQKSIGTKNDLAKLADGSAKTREETIEEYASTVESKTLSELMCDYGIITKSKSKLGGKREGAGRPRKIDPESAAGAAEAAENKGFASESAKELTVQLYTQGVVNQGFEAMDRETLKSVVTTLKQTLKEAETILAGAK